MQINYCLIYFEVRLGILCVKDICVTISLCWWKVYFYATILQINYNNRKDNISWNIDIENG